MIEIENKNNGEKQPVAAPEALPETRKNAGSRPVIDPTINPATLPSLDDKRDPDHKRKKTAGEKLFDRTVYTGIGFGVNEGAALVIADQFEHGVGKKTFAKIADWMVKSLKFGEKIAKDGKVITPRQNAANALLTFVLLLDGTLLVAPMKMLEDHKASLVKKANHFFDRHKGSKLTETEVAARDKEVDKAIACEPDQSWPSLLVGRVLAVGATMTTSMYLMGAERMTKAGNFSENLLTKGKFTTAPANPEGHVKTAGQRYAFLAGIETICCAISSVTLEVCSKFFARRNSRRHNDALCDTPADSAPKADTAATDTKNSAAAPDKKPLEAYKSKKITPMESHADLATQAQASHSLG